MPKPRALTRAAELEAFAEWKTAPARGVVAALARRYGVTWVGMRGILDRLEQDQQFKDSCESLIRELADAP